MDRNSTVSPFSHEVVQHTDGPRRVALRAAWRWVRVGYQVVAFACVLLTMALLAQAGGIWADAKARQQDLCVRQDAAAQALREGGQ